MWVEPNYDTILLYCVGSAGGNGSVGDGDGSDGGGDGSDGGDGGSDGDGDGGSDGGVGEVRGNSGGRWLELESEEVVGRERK